MEKYFNVEILGDERSVYGGIDGHYCGTEVVGHRVCDIMDIEERDDLLVQVHPKSKYINSDYISINDPHFVDPVTHNRGIAMPYTMYDIMCVMLMVNRSSDAPWDEWMETSMLLDYKGIPLKRFKEILINL